MEQLEIRAVESHEEELQKRRDEQDAALLKEQVEAVFHLGGGELSDEAWGVRESREGVVQWHYFYHWYEGPPEYARQDYPDRHDVSYRTVVRDCLFGLPPEKLEDEDGTWFRVDHFTASGEAECPLRDCDEEGEHLPCKLCEGSEEDGHGHIYLGDGWAEVLYKQDPVLEVMTS